MSKINENFKVLDQSHNLMLFNTLKKKLSEVIKKSSDKKFDTLDTLKSILDKLNEVKESKNPLYIDIYEKLRPGCSPCVFLGGAPPKIIGLLFCLLLFSRIEGFGEKAPSRVMTTEPSKLFETMSDSTSGVFGGKDECELNTYLLTNRDWGAFVDGICKTGGSTGLDRPFESFWGKTIEYELSSGNYNEICINAGKYFKDIIKTYLAAYPIVIGDNEVAKIPINLVFFKKDGTEEYGHAITLVLNSEGHHGFIDAVHLADKEDGRFPLYATVEFNDFLDKKEVYGDFYETHHNALGRLLKNAYRPKPGETSNISKVTVGFPEKLPEPGTAIVDTLFIPEIVNDLRVASAAVDLCLKGGFTEEYCEEICSETAEQHMRYSSDQTLASTPASTPAPAPPPAPAPTPASSPNLRGTHKKGDGALGGNVKKSKRKSKRKHRKTKRIRKNKK